MKLRKRIVALGAAMTMAVSMMSIGASAYKSKTNWRVSNINSNTSNYYYYRADGFNLYYVNVGRIVNGGYGKKVKHYCCYYTKDIITGNMLYKMCSNQVYSYTSSLDFTVDYYRNYIPPYNKQVKAWFNLDTNGKQNYEVTATGYLRTNN